MTRDEKINLIVNQYRDGLHGLTKTTADLDNMKVRGGFSKGLNYTGYDYTDQKWIEIP